MGGLRKNLARGDSAPRITIQAGFTDKGIDNISRNHRLEIKIASGKMDRHGERLDESGGRLEIDGWFFVSDKTGVVRLGSWLNVDALTDGGEVVTIKYNHQGKVIGTSIPASVSESACNALGCSPAALQLDEKIGVLKGNGLERYVDGSMNPIEIVKEIVATGGGL